MTDAAYDNHFNGNTISENCETAILASSDSHDNQFIGNTVNHNVLGCCGPGFFVGGDDNVISNNEISFNHGGGLYFSAGAVGNTVRDNTIKANTGEGIRVDAGSSGNFIEGNTAQSNGLDLADYNNNSPPDCSNAWMNNTFATDSEHDGPGAGCIQ
jgi:parallel beta-helix repeat protein